MSQSADQNHFRGMGGMKVYVHCTARLKVPYRYSVSVYSTHKTGRNYKTGSISNEYYYNNYFDCLLSYVYEKKL